VKPLDGAVAVVTGGTRGIGRACAAMLARNGARVVTVARSAEASVSCDLSDPAAVEKAIDAIRVAYGCPQILVNNAGIFRMAPLHETPPDHFEQAFNVNLFAPFLFIRAFVADMKRRGSGDIVNIGSIADRVTFTENAAYSATKFGARAMHEVLRAELRGSGVRASLISPGPVNTDIWNEVDPDSKPGFTPRSAMLSPEAVASAVEFAITSDREMNIDELRLSRT
jgi:NAD(P)-dependent dehydrogenase (short-subunit alcohol dehydrogenase family)